jgi:hypothetical protein
MPAMVRPAEPSVFETLLAQHDVVVPTDNAFQRRARLLQALWRHEQGLAIGEHRGRPLGSRLTMPHAKETLSNYITDGVRAVVRREVLDPDRAKDKLYGRPRIFNDLLSSQPLCFNLFGELQGDLPLASRALGRMTDGRISTVSAIHFEHSPGRGNPRYTGDRSAFDVFVEFVTPEGKKGFAGIEVKYHEDLNDPPAPHRARYDEIATTMACFDSTASPRLKAKPLQQVWRDHLLAGSLLVDPDAGYDDGFFVFLHPSDNDRCVRAVAAYRACLTSDASFVPWTLEGLVEALRAEGSGQWVEVFARRYLAFGRITSS